MQYSLRTLMVVMTCVAVACFVLFVLPAPWSGLLLGLLLGSCFLLASTAVLSLLIYGEGNIRAFAIGCVLPLSSCWISFRGGMLLPTSSDQGGFLFIIGVVTFASGFVSVGVRRYCVRRMSKVSKDARKYE